jgi:hypothetical protein
MALRKTKLRLLSRLPGLEQLSASGLLRAALVILLAAAALLHLRSAFFAQLGLNKGEHTAAFVSELGNPDALAALARKEHLGNARLHEARILYSLALQNYILHVPSWLGLAELFNDMGDEEQAKDTLRFIHSFAGNKEDVAWMKAVLADQLDEERILSESLQWLAANRPGARQEVFALADLRWPEPGRMMSMFTPDIYPAILAFYMRGKNPHKAGTFWRETERVGLIERKHALDYVNFLIGLKEVEQAGAIWRKYFHDENTLLHNPSFKEPLLGSPLNWRLSGAKGFSRQLLENQNGVKIFFDGTQNIDFQLEQIVPLRPGSYQFSGMIETLDLTTDQRPYWMVTGYNCSEPRVKELMLPANLAAEKFMVNFTLPAPCAAVRLALRRNQSFFFDNKLAGTVIISDLDLQSRSMAQEPSGEKGTDELLQSRPGLINININKMKVY